MNEEAIRARLADAYEGLPAEHERGLRVRRGKVRDVARGSSPSGEGLLALVASDRLSAFDRVLTTIPFKGEVLSRISLYWFEATSDLVPNHLADSPMPEGTGRVTFAREASMIPIEVVVRGYLAGSAWRDYAAGRAVSGIALPGGLKQNERLGSPIITPSTKEENGHDQPVSREEIVSRGLVDAELWYEVEKAALKLFKRGAEVARSRGLILVDTKYEFGLIDGRLAVADEIHTPDSSRYWYLDDYDVRLAAGLDQRELDKEYFRRWLRERGFSGDGEVPAIDDEIRVDTALRYVHAYEKLTGERFVSRSASAQADRDAVASSLAKRLA
jgi:phosphoribosylaminoimidazole-succinocarboxamide synthase